MGNFNHIMNFDDFIRHGGRYEIIRLKERHRNRLVGEYRVFIGGIMSVCNVTVYSTGARMLNFLPETSHEAVMAILSRGTDRGMREESFGFLLRNFLVGLDFVLQGLFFFVFPIMFIVRLVRGAAAEVIIPQIALSVFIGALLYLIIPRIRSLFIIPHNDWHELEGKVHES